MGVVTHLIKMKHTAIVQVARSVLGPIMLAVAVLITGTGFDVVRYVSASSSLQDNLDRAVLEASSLDTTANPAEVVRSLMSDPAVPSQTAVTVRWVVDDTSRSVDASAHAVVDTYFMRLVGVDLLPVKARSLAEERLPVVEMSAEVEHYTSAPRSDPSVTYRLAADRFFKMNAH